MVLVKKMVGLNFGVAVETLVIKQKKMAYLKLVLGNEIQQGTGRFFCGWL